MNFENKTIKNHFYLFFFFFNLILIITIFKTVIIMLIFFPSYIILSKKYAKGNINITLSILSNIPPCPGIKLL